VQQGGHQLGSSSSQGVAQRAPTPVDVELAQVCAQLPLPCQGHHSEGLVDLVQVDVLDAQTRSPQHSLGGWDGAGEPVQATPQPQVGGGGGGKEEKERERQLGASQVGDRAEHEHEEMELT
jgi:hypothetical protein